MVKVVFEYKDNFSNGEWERQQCIVRTVDECIKLYGLGLDCDYRIIDVKEV